jgi:hypothetical protein
MHASSFTTRSFGLFDIHSVKQVIECRFVEFDVRAIGVNGINLSEQARV